MTAAHSAQLSKLSEEKVFTKNGSLCIYVKNISAQTWEVNFT